MPADLADAVVDWIDADDDLSGGAARKTRYYLAPAAPLSRRQPPMVQVDELYRVRGFDATAVARVKPVRDARCRARTPVNVNTALGVVLAAMRSTRPREKVRRVRRRSA